MVERRSEQEFSLAHCTRATWKRMVLVTRLPFLFNRKGSLVTRTITTLPVDIWIETMALSKSLATSSSLPDLPPQPSHPPSKFVFPKREFGKKQMVKRSCQASWLSRGPGCITRHTTQMTLYFAMCVCVCTEVQKDGTKQRRPCFYK